MEFYQYWKSITEPFLRKQSTASISFNCFRQGSKYTSARLWTLSWFFRLSAATPINSKILNARLHFLCIDSAHFEKTWEKGCELTQFWIDFNKEPFFWLNSNRCLCATLLFYIFAFYSSSKILTKKIDIIIVNLEHFFL